MSDQWPPARLPGLQVIAIVRTERKTPEHTPVQSALNTQETGVIEVDDRFSAALDGLEGFDYAWLISWLGSGEPNSDQVPLHQVPFLLRRQPREVGVLATRGPRRINPIGLSLVRILDVGPSSIRFAGVDLTDGTPVVDIKRLERPVGAVVSLGTPGG